MENLIWYLIMLPCCAMLTGIGIYAWNRKKPMWFWAGTEVKETEIADIKAYNHANGIMWGLYSVPFWAATFIGVWSGSIALILLAAGCVLGFPLMIAAYKRVYAKYKA